MKRLLVLGGLNSGVEWSIDEAAASVAIAMAEAKIDLVCQRGADEAGGFMRAMTTTIKARGGHVTSVAMDNAPREHIMNEREACLAISTRQECKRQLSTLASGILVLPGGVGTLEIVMEYLTWIRVIRQVAPIYLVNVEGFWDPFVNMFDRMGDKAFLPDGFSKRYVLIDNLKDVVTSLEAMCVSEDCGNTSSVSGEECVATTVAKLKPRQVCVYCGSTTGKDPAYAEAAKILGHEVAAAGLGLVYGGARVGLMGLLAATAMSNGGTVTGIMPSALVDVEKSFRDITSYHEVRTYHQRKMSMCNVSDAFIAMPGGPGTLEEVVEQLAWAEMGYHNKPIVIVNVDGYWSPLLDLLKLMRDEVPGAQKGRSIYTSVDGPKQAVEWILECGRLL